MGTNSRADPMLIHTFILILANRQANDDSSLTPDELSRIRNASQHFDFKMQDTDTVQRWFQQFCEPKNQSGTPANKERNRFSRCMQRPFSRLFREKSSVRMNQETSSADDKDAY